MKYLQKLILPFLLATVILIIYSVYFSPEKGLGSFADFDPNNSAVKDIKVKVLHERGIERDNHGGVKFYAADKHNTIIRVNADKAPKEIESAETVILRGHLSQNNSFHAHDVLPE